jgi:hypothetical protein
MKKKATVYGARLRKSKHPTLQLPSGCATQGQERKVKDKKKNKTLRDGAQEEQRRGDDGQDG